MKIRKLFVACIVVVICLLVFAFNAAYVRVPYGSLPRIDRLSALGRLAGRERRTPDHTGIHTGTRVAIWIWLDERPGAMSWPNIEGAVVESVNAGSADALGADPRAGDWLVELSATFEATHLPDTLIVQMIIDKNEVGIEVQSMETARSFLAALLTEEAEHRIYANRFVRLRIDRINVISDGQPVAADSDVVDVIHSSTFTVGREDRFVAAIKDGDRIIVGRGRE